MLLDYQGYDEDINQEAHDLFALQVKYLHLHLLVNGKASIGLSDECFCDKDFLEREIASFTEYLINSEDALADNEPNHEPAAYRD